MLMLNIPPVGLLATVLEGPGVQIPEPAKPRRQSTAPQKMCSAHTVCHPREFPEYLYNGRYAEKYYNVTKINVFPDF